METDLYEHMPVFSTMVVNTETLGMAFEPEQKFENPDGTPITFDRDYFNAPRSQKPMPGPLESAAASIQP